MAFFWLCLYLATMKELFFSLKGVARPCRAL